MKPTENPDEGFKTSAAKVVIGIRGLPSLSMELDNEAAEKGMSKSNYAEMILLSRHQPNLESERLAQVVAEQQKEIERLNAQVTAGGAQQAEVMQAENKRLKELVAVQQKEIETLRAQVAVGAEQSVVTQAEMEKLREKIEEQDYQLGIYRDKRLIYLSENLKGKTDTVKNAYGNDFDITYDSPVQVLLSMIYSTKLNK